MQVDLLRRTESQRVSEEKDGAWRAWGAGGVIQETQKYVLQRL